jgi:hypothetical protein
VSEGNARFDADDGKTAHRCGPSVDNGGGITRDRVSRSRTRGFELVELMVAFRDVSDGNGRLSRSQEIGGYRRMEAVCVP